MYGDLEKLVNPEKGEKKKFSDAHAKFSGQGFNGGCGQARKKEGSCQKTNHSRNTDESGCTRDNKRHSKSDRKFGKGRHAQPSITEDMDILNQQIKQACALNGHDSNAELHKNRPHKHAFPHFKPHPPNHKPQQLYEPHPPRHRPPPSNYHPHNRSMYEPHFQRPPTHYHQHHCYDFRQPPHQNYPHGSKLCPPEDPHLDPCDPASECEKNSGSYTENERAAFPQRNPAQIIEAMRGEYHPDVRDPSNTQLSIATREWDHSALEHGCRLLEQRVGKKKAARTAGVLVGDLIEYWELHYGFSDSDLD